jgi:hypothetical protein
LPDRVPLIVPGDQRFRDAPHAPQAAFGEASRTRLRGFYRCMAHTKTRFSPTIRDRENVGVQITVKLQPEAKVTIVTIGRQNRQVAEQ